ncbi:adenylyl-sulfate kinase, partial [candidate division GN15 bacterium]|nr:adenylyl-sulfate kinase [candidate division GN15 bacterium]
YLECPLEECERRDPKGMYRKARAGLISNFTGVDDPFEPPTLPDLRVDTKHLTVDQAAEQVIAYMKDRQLL